ncbi:MAG: MBL fold metallo-hydrolase [Pseudomonadota bacterium]
MYFHPIEDPDTGQIGYLLADATEQKAAVIDLPPRSTELLRALLAERRLALTHVLRTHVHRGVQMNCAALSDLTGATLVLPEGAPAPADCAVRVKAAHDGGYVVFGQQVLQILDTPGHTAHCVSYLWRDRLFCGDAFDLGSCADAGEDADPGLMFDTLSGRLFQLPGSTLLFPAHPLGGRRVALVGEQRLRTASLLTGSRDAFITEMLSRRTTAQRRARPSPATRRH